MDNNSYGGRNRVETITEGPKPSYFWPLDARQRKDTNPTMTDHDKTIDGVGAYWGPNMKK